MRKFLIVFLMLQACAVVPRIGTVTYEPVKTIEIFYRNGAFLESQKTKRDEKIQNILSDFCSGDWSLVRSGIERYQVGSTSSVETNYYVNPTGNLSSSSTQQSTPVMRSNVRLLYKCNTEANYEIH